MSKRAFTLVEMSAVIVVLAVFSALVVPNLLSQRESRAAVGFFVKLPDVAVFAREHAQENRVTTRLKYDDSQSTLQIVEDAPPQPLNTTGSLRRPTDTSTSDTPVKEVTVPAGIEATTFRTEDETATSSDWSIVFYPDGRSDGGAIEFSDRGRRRSLVVDPDGTARLTEGALPNAEERKWPAGEREQRL